MTHDAQDGLGAARAPASRALRAVLAGRVQGVGLRQATRRRAGELGVLGWVRNQEDGTVAVHAEGPATAIAALLAFLREGPRGAEVAQLASEDVRVEGHEQFAIRGVPAGAFVVQQHAARALHFDLRLEVEGVMRSWAVPKGPSLDPAVKRLAMQVPDHAPAHNSFEGPTAKGGAVVVWDRGVYEQGGRVAWPQALERGHAVFALHGQKLRGGFALQRTGGTGGTGSGSGSGTSSGSGSGSGTSSGSGATADAKSRWLLVKRRDEHARPGSDIVAERPESVLSGLTLEEVLAGGR